MKFIRHFGLLATAGFVILTAPASAQRQQGNPDQRIDRLERQVEQMQRQVFPRGRPADTAGIGGEPAATQSSVATLDQRLDAVERQMADMLRQSEENSHRLQTVEADITRVRADQEQRIAALEQRLSNSGPAVPVVTQPLIETAPKPSSPRPQRGGSTVPTTTVPASASAIPTSDPAEDAYTEGFKLWEAGSYDQSIASLRAFTAAYPKHRRVSYANNLIGRSLLDKGQARAAAEAFLANYRGNPSGERAADSLYYLGQSLMKLGQPGQACKSYAELDAVFGSKVRPDLKKQVVDAEAQAKCS